MQRSNSILLATFSMVAVLSPAFAAGTDAPAPTAAPSATATPPAAVPPAVSAPAAPVNPQTQAAADAAASADAQALATVNRQLLTAEESVHRTKESVFRAKATLQLLKEIVIEGSANGAHVLILHEDKLGSGFTLSAVTYLLDGQSKLSKVDSSGALDQTRELKVDDASIAPGQHALAVDFKVTPTGFGVFKYATDYSIDVRQTYAFTVEIGKACTIHATISEKGSAADAMEQRVKAGFDMKCETQNAR